MMYELDLAVMATATGIAILAAVYLWSKDPGRQGRAWELLRAHAPPLSHTPGPGPDARPRSPLRGPSST